MTEETPSPKPADAPVDPLFTHPASPFIQTEAPTPVGFAPPPSPTPPAAIYSTWVLYRTQIEFGLAMLAYLMVLVGSVVVVQANPEAAWRYYVVVLPVALSGPPAPWPPLLPSLNIQSICTDAGGLSDVLA